MKIEAMHIGMKVKHPAYGAGSVKTISERTVDISFDDGSVRTVSPDGSALQPAEAQVEVSGLEVSLEQFIEQVAGKVVEELGLEKPDQLVQELGRKWNGGKMMLHPKDESLQPKEIPMETFFHKVVMMRNNLRVLEQKINSSDTLNEGEKVELQQYITRCYGSMTTFNLLFADKKSYFGKH